MKGIILAGGSGTRLFPVTKLISKHLMYVFDKPMIYYPISTLILAGIKEILLIGNNKDINHYKIIIGNGSQWGIKIDYQIQEKPNGIAEAFIIAKHFIKDSSCCLILGDNIFYGNILTEILSKAVKKNKNCTILTYHVDKPQNFGIVKFSKNGQVKKITEKPKKFIGNQAVVGMYFFNKEVVKIASNIKKSKRGELEITEVINQYIKKYHTIDIIKLGRGVTWFDAGTFDDLLRVSNFVKITEDLQGLKIGCLDEIAFSEKLISKKQFIELIKKEKNPENKIYLKKVLKDSI